MKAQATLIRSYCFLFLFFIALGASQSTVAQVDNATLTGTVTDANGGALPGARVEVVNQATNSRVEVTTGDDGNYTLVNLRPGRYRVTVEQQNFRREERPDIELTVGQRARLDIALTVGAVTESVTVTGESLALNRDDATLSNIVDNRRITTLPLPQRTWDDLLPQVAGTQGDPYTEQAGGTASGRTGGVNIHGVRSLMNNFILDGQDNNSISTNVQELSTQVVRPSVDAISEFRVITAPYSAETGRAAGGVISVTTRSGTNRFSGLLYEYARNRVFDANDFFSNAAGRDRPARNQHQFGGNFGGPFVRDRAFFFADFEATRIRQGQLRLTNVPTLAARRGDFSSNLGAPLFRQANGSAGTTVTGTPITVVDTAGNTIQARQGQVFRRSDGRAYAGNIIPTSDFNPVAVRLLSFYPEPTLPGATNNFFRTPNLSDDQNRFTTRLDYRVNDANNLFGRYVYTVRDRFVPGFFGGIADGTNTSAWGQNNISSHSLTVGLNTVFSPTIVNQFRFGYNRANAAAVQEPFGQGSSSEFVPGIPNDSIVQGGLPGILISGFDIRLGSPDFLPKFQRSQQYQFTDTISYTRGTQTYRFGVDVMAPLILDYLDVPQTRGTLSFDGTYTAGAGLPGTGNAVADFLTGNARRAQLGNVFVVNQRRHMYAFFVQDDWRVSPRLTINLGLRYDFGSPSYEANNSLVNLDQTAAARAMTSAEAFAALRRASDGSLENRALVRADRNNFSPRLGFAFSLNDRTVIRGGYGISYNLVDRIGSEDQLSLNPPFFVNFDFTSGASAPAVNLSTGFAPNALSTDNLDLRRVRLRVANPDASTSYIQQGSISLQRQFGRDYFAEVSYVTTRGSHLMTLRDLNQALPGAKPSAINDANLAVALPVRAQFFPFPAFGLIEYRDDNGVSNYHSMEATFDKRFSQGYTLRAVYTLSRSLDNSFEHLTGGGSNSFPQNARNYDEFYGPSDFDVRHRFVVNGIFELPFGRNRRFFREGIASAIFGGFELAGSFNARSGRPFTVFQSGDPLSLGGLSSTLPDLVGNPYENVPAGRAFNPAAFSALPPGTTRFGVQERNSLRGPSFAALDVSLHRRFNLGSETRYLDLRWEVFNALNHANFGLPNRSISATSSGNAGTITTLAGDPRVMQFAFRFVF